MLFGLIGIAFSWLASAFRQHTNRLEEFIKERRLAEAALCESEDRYRDLVEYTEDLVCTHDLKGRLLSANPAAGSLLGHEIDELLRIPMPDLIAPEFRSQYDRYLHRIEAKGADSGFLCVLAKDGRVGSGNTEIPCVRQVCRIRFAPGHC